MVSERAHVRAPSFIGPPGYARHWPEATLLYQLVERYYPEFVAARESLGRYFAFYNSRRPHSSLDRVTPDQFYVRSLPMHQAA